MIALVLAAQLTAAAPPPLLQDRAPLRQPAASEHCKSNGVVEAAAPSTLLFRDDGKTRASRLADLPKPNKEKAVLRSVDGCANPLVVQFDVGP